MTEQGLTYKDAGVDIDAGEEAVESIRRIVESTFNLSTEKIITNLGGFSAVVELPDGRIMALTVDGVGTKLVVAILLNVRKTVGIDLVAMCVNDLLAGGVRPSLFLDYMSLGKQVPVVTRDIVKGMAEGCKQGQCALIGGEMAEMAGMYESDEYDLAGFAVGFAESRESLILGEAIRPGMKVYGLPSSGLHSNGFSLYREMFGVDLKTPEASINALNTHYDEIGRTIGEELLTPTKIYTQEILDLIGRYEIAGLANITGGGLVENPPRVFPDGCGIVIKLNSWQRQPVFDFIQKKGNIALPEMLRTTNYGIGFMVISPDDIKDGVFYIGDVIESDEKKVFFE